MFGKSCNRIFSLCCIIWLYIRVKLDKIPDVWQPKLRIGFFSKLISESSICIWKTRFGYQPAIWIRPAVKIRGVFINITQPRQSQKLQKSDRLFGWPDVFLPYFRNAYVMWPSIYHYMPHHYYGVLSFWYTVIPRIRRLKFCLYVSRKMIMLRKRVFRLILKRHRAKPKPCTYVLVHAVPHCVVC